MSVFRDPRVQPARMAYYLRVAAAKAAPAVREVFFELAQKAETGGATTAEVCAALAGGVCDREPGEEG